MLNSELMNAKLFTADHNCAKLNSLKKTLPSKF
jgi:hypothetical protein